MASAAQDLYQTDVFGPQNQQMITGSAATQGADVLARRERREMRNRRFIIRLPIPGESIELIYSSFDSALPTWSLPVLQSLSERWGSQPGWDGYEAATTNVELVVKLLNILSDLMPVFSIPPLITPLADGGVQAEWHHNAQDLEIVVPAVDNPTYYYFNRRTNSEEGELLGPNYSRVQNLIELVS
jgi:hypothetical protein